MADSFLCEELLTETNHEILRHLETCPPCRTELDGRRRLRATLRAAFERAPQLQPSASFPGRLRGQLREVSLAPPRSRALSRRWFALAAGIVLAIGAAGVTFVKRPPAPADALARDAVGDHRNCALKYRLVRMPVPLEEAAQRFDSAYRLLLNAPPDQLSTPGGLLRVNERHSCAFGSRRFGHVVMEYHGRVVSLLMTANDGGARGAETTAIPHLIGRPMNGLSVMSVDGARHAILLVSDLNSTDLAQVAKAVSIPLAQHAAIDSGVRLWSLTAPRLAATTLTGLSYDLESGVPRSQSERR
jgi:anti-sigma factor RsiW